ncbi:MAG: hypothetical protein K2Y39_10025 [Candidatus Obscuribacterales bacterium]|nr:hypothetical protein [Candidatus Obscuribacterales bacterium]
MFSVRPHKSLLRKHRNSSPFRGFVALSLSVLTSFFATVAFDARTGFCYGADDSYQEQRGARLSPQSVLTWWSHDATGYHPAVGLLLENSSGRDLGGILIRFQGRFLDLRNGYTQVARDEWDGEYHRNQQRFLKLRGPTPYELPIDKDQWPRIECKVMCRVGTVNDESTQDLVVTRIDRITMTDEEAMEKLRQDQGRRIITRQPSAPSEPPRRPKEIKREPVKPLVATAGSLNGEKPAASKPLPGNTRPGLNRLLAQTSFAGIGDDFFAFEQAFKRPRETDAKDAAFTWAKFVPDADGVEIIVGSKGRTGKADIILAVIPQFLVSQDSQIVTLAQLLYKKHKTERLKGPTYSVRYLPSGRVQVGALSGTGCRGAIFFPRGQVGNENNYLIQLSRLPEDLDNLLSAQARRVPMLSVYAPFAGIDTSN